MDYKLLLIKGISYSQTRSGAFVLLLEELESSLKLPIVIGESEARAISIGLEQDIKTDRPLTHDLFKSFITATRFSLHSIIIHQFLDGVFFSNMIFKDGDNGEELILDSRTSDAVAMAVRFGVSIYTTEEVLKDAGVSLNLEKSDLQEDLERRVMLEIGSEEMVENDDLSLFSINQLEGLLQEAIEEENYDDAIELQEEIKKRRKKID